jgi:hypothetical protein
MKNKSFVAAISIGLILFFTVAGALVIGVARANPVPWPATPNQEKPTLKIETPQNNTEYNADSVYLNFTITRPDSWHNPQWAVVPFGQVASVEVYLDGSIINLTYSYSDNAVPDRLSKDSSYFAKVNQSASGLHTLNVTVLSYTYYRGPAYNGTHILTDIMSSSGPVYEYPIVVSDIVYFTIPEEPSPLPQAAELFPTATVAAISLVTVTLVGTGLLVYFKKPKR